MVLEEADLDLWLLRGAVYISRTIVVTAMSGVAANLLIGETTHSVLGLNQNETVVMKGTQLLVVSNNATTGHKLQGSSVDCIFVHNWIYKKNWAYDVVLSRVRTHKGLYLRHQLSMDHRMYAVSPKLAEMLLSFERRQCQPLYFQDHDYQMEFAYTTCTLETKYYNVKSTLTT
jgi:hypothetical protein